MKLVKSTGIPGEYLKALNDLNELLNTMGYCELVS